jgi:hypothetical protein
MSKRGEEVVTGSRRPLGYQQILQATLATAQSLSVPAPGAGNYGLYAVIQSNAGTIRWRDDGVAPTATVGMLIPSGGELLYAGDLYKIQLIDGGSGTPIADISYYY